ncbi:MAG: FecR family protein [Dongiaceae bacterium]
MKASRSRKLTLGAGLLACLLPLPALAELGDAAGVTGAVQGDVAIDSPARKTSIEQVASGEDVVTGDAVNTRAKSRLQIMLLDQTAITMGENASLVIDEFVYDPDNANAALSASVAQGAFRLVTGGVARNNPDGTKVKLPSAVLTIRGTSTQGNCDSSGCIVALSGTGDQNSAGKKPSQILIESDKDRKILKRAGFFVLIRPDGTMTDPEPLEDDAAQRLAGLFDPLTGKGDYLGGLQLVDASGQPTADGGPFVEDFDDIYDDTIPLENVGFESTSNLPSGQLTYFGDDIPMNGFGSVGFYRFDYSLDLANREFSGLVTFNVSGTLVPPVSGSFQLLHNPFDQGFQGLHESGFVIDTPQNDTIVVDYSIGTNQIDTAVAYTVPQSFGGPVTISGAGPAPLVTS